jgi:hypothetical protein
MVTWKTNNVYEEKDRSSNWWRKNCSNLSIIVDLNRIKIFFCIEMSNLLKSDHSYLAMTGEFSFRMKLTIILREILHCLCHLNNPHLFDNKIRFEKVNKTYLLSFVSFFLISTSKNKWIIFSIFSFLFHTNQNLFWYENKRFESFFSFTKKSNTFFFNLIEFLYSMIWTVNDIKIIFSIKW